ncbi:MAG: FecR family protein [Prolixibacteraceae bacterium]|nr:FecR family protein [Prolixibacteraceae bacterium]
MKTNQAHNKQHFADQHSKNFLAGGKISWSKSAETVWTEMEQSIRNKPEGRAKIVMTTRLLSMAAVLLLLVGLGSFFRFYKISIETPAGMHQLATLPDGSTIELNAESSLTYHPYWWRFKRELTFNGEAFFEVQKGKTFTVHSAMGTTRVLGTSFNILARDQIYRVICITGSVQVTSKTLNEAILKAREKAEIKPDGSIEVHHEVETFQEISWKDNIFLFTAVPLHEVFREIERQFGVTILVNANKQVLYTGNFSRNHNLEEVLSYVCPPFGLDFQRKDQQEYLIFPLQE